MKNKFTLLNLIFLTFSLGQTEQVCPSKELIQPCTCQGEDYGRNIRCEGNQVFDLAKMFDTLDKHYTNSSDKQFSVFHLATDQVKELKANTFSGITFEEIFIGYCHNLISIDRNAFNGTDSVTEYLSFYNNTGLTSPDNSIYDLAKKFTYLRYFELEHSNVTQIPKDAFGALEHLLEAHFAGESFQVISPQAFSKLPSLIELTFEQVNFKTIPDGTFEFDSSANYTFILDLSNSPDLSSSSFTNRTLLGMKRPALIRLGNKDTPNEVTYLEDKFLDFLLENERNSIDLSGEAFDCQDCRSAWLKDNAKALSRVTNIKCSDNKPFDDPVHFKSCTS